MEAIKGHLGHIQQACLRYLADDPEGEWSLTRSRVVWGTRKDTAQAMGRLVKRGLAGHDPHRGVFTITDEGRKQAR